MEVGDEGERERRESDSGSRVARYKHARKAKANSRHQRRSRPRSRARNSAPEKRQSNANQCGQIGGASRRYVENVIDGQNTRAQIQARTALSLSFSLSHKR
eukprot:gb/GEZJ01004659.1/.p4 GENE.gb/GEZJ01004659.1/~~gb/GEZJ01004659.1/.p4  ORF type:complete len:101 (+),score=6.55 gb/GEZJ01004659.1/:486-788(+)